MNSQIALLLLGLALAVRPGLALESLPVLEEIRAVRALTPQEAARHYPVKLLGTVTYYSRQDNHAFLQDETGGIFFRPGALGQPGRTEFTHWERVEIQGVSVQGNFSPSIAGAPTVPGMAPVPVRAVRLGPGVLPDPPLVTMEQIQAGGFHDQFVKLRATIRAVELREYLGAPRLGLVLSSPRRTEDAKIRAFIPFPEATAPAWENVVAEICGVVAGNGDEQARLRDVHFLIPTPAQVAPQFELMRAAFAQTPRGIAELFRYEPPDARGASPYVRVKGVVTLVRPREGLYLGAGPGGLWVQTTQRMKTAPGDELDVIGLPARDELRAFLQDAIFRPAGRGPLPTPRAVSVAEAASGSVVSTRIAVSGELVDKLQQPGHRQLILEDGGRTFQARIAQEADTPADYGWKTGSRLRLTGICENPIGGARDAALSSFTLLIGSAADVAVLRQPPWLTPARVRWLLLALVATVALGALWLTQLRRQVARQTQVIEQQTEHKTLTEERQRIARELHDTLEQQLAGVQFQLDALHDWMPDAPADIGHALGSARAMLDHARTEARRSVWELRSQMLERAGLTGALRQWAVRLSTGNGPRLEFRTEGPERRLTRAVEFQLLRCAQEAVANALKHAAASRIDIALTFSETETRLTVTDDGRGFDPAMPLDDGRPHFGLLGLRERAGKLQARFEIRTSPGTGTTLSVIVLAQVTTSP